MKKLEMSSEEMNKKEKGKEIATKKMVLSEEEIDELLQRNMENYKRESSSSSSSSKITPRIFYTSDEKARLRWSTDLHNCFLKAVEKLGGPKKATPKKVKEKMEIEGLSVHHVKSHLQKFRLGKCNIQDAKNQYLRRFKNARDIKRCASSLNSSRPQANIKPRGTGAVKSKPRKEKEVEGPLYTLIKNDVRVRRCHEEQRMQKALAIESQSNMFETESFRASTTPSLQSQQHNNYDSSSQEPSSHRQDYPSYNNVEGQTNPFKMNYTLQGPSIITPQNITSVEDLCNDGMSCLSLSEPAIDPSQGNLQFNHNMAQGFINPYMTFGSQLVQPGLATITTQSQLQINDVFHDSNGNTTFYSATVPLPFDSLHHQGTLNNTSLFSTTPQSVPAYCLQHGYMSSYPPYNTLEVVRAQLSALQNSGTNQTQGTASAHEAPVEEDDPVEKYIDWGKVEEKDIFF